MKEPLPPLLNRMRDTLGEAAMLRIAHDFGGRRFKVPAPERLKSDHPLAASLGLSLARRFCEEFGPGRIDVPLGPYANGPKQRRAILAELKRGRSNGAVARQFNMTERGIERIRSRSRHLLRDDRQKDLFGG